MEVSKPMTVDRAGTEVPQCKMCEKDAVTLLHGRFPFCSDHYQDVIQA